MGINTTFCIFISACKSCDPVLHDQLHIFVHWVAGLVLVPKRFQGSVKLLVHNAHVLLLRLHIKRQFLSLLQTSSMSCRPACYSRALCTLAPGECPHHSLGSRIAHTELCTGSILSDQIILDHLQPYEWSALW